MYDVCGTTGVQSIIVFIGVCQRDVPEMITRPDDKIVPSSREPGPVTRQERHLESKEPWEEGLL